jgi:hypothetical protein
MTAQFEGGDAGFGLADQIEGQEPNRQRQLGGLQDGACNDGGLMAADAALIALQAPSVDNAVVMASATGTTETSRPSSLLQSCHTKLFGSVQTLKIQQGKPLLKLNAVSRHGLTSNCVPQYRPGRGVADQAG